MFYKNLFYFDIETVGEYKDIDSLKEKDERGYLLFKEKYEHNPWMQDTYKLIDDSYVKNSPLFSTFGKIVCISFGYYHTKTPQGYTVSSIYGDIEQDIMVEFQSLIDKASKRHMILSGYFVKGFDIPWVLHKMNKYNIEPPKLLDIYGKKPWEIPVFDLADEWKQQGRTSVSLNEVAYELGVNTDMDDIDGREVHKTYWKDNDMMKIKNHCENDVLNSMRIAERMLKYKMI